MSLPVPYPADVRAKGWRFELDHERIEQSSTWVLAPAEMRPWLLMLWLTAWKQTPCGSLDDDDALIAARIGMSAKLFQKHRAVLRRGWWLAVDGRLYHNTIVERVGEMLAAKDKERTRKAAYRQRMDAGRAAPSHGDGALSHGTDTGQTGDSHGSDPGRDDTGTGTGTGTTSSLRSEDISAVSPKYPVDFEAAWTAYPKRPGASKADSLKAWTARIKSGVDANELLAGVNRYADYCQACQTDPAFIKQPSTFFGPGEHYLSDWTPPAPGARSAVSGNKHSAAAAAIFDMSPMKEVVDA